ncbi:YdeI/OmpD-associated family protein [Nitriliruptor alkaliphilus]|uniref:YdeI/OmpD-associated family protein n=1 Tax=Nitriliruptor alkaliphilus TaxID=427918 RepID=UPI000695B0C3
MEDGAAFEAWLEANHDQRTSIWLRVAKKASGIPSITTAEALDVALCFGWIDGQRRALDRTHFLQRYSPRRPRGTWSQVNVAKVEALTAAGRMRPAGLAEVAAAQADGRWDAAYASQRTATMPEDLAAALAADEAAATFFETLGRTDRYAVYLRLMTARSPEDRAARLTAAVTDLAASHKVAF